MSALDPLNDALEDCARNLPAGYEIRVCVESAAGWVELIGPDGTVDLDTDSTDSLATKVRAGLALAIIEAAA